MNLRSLRQLMRRPAARPLPLIALAWLAQLLLGVLMAQLQPIPIRPLVIERSSCSQAQWQQLVEQHYRDLRGQHQLGQRRWQPVVIFSVLAEERHPAPPDPAALLRIVGVGDRDPRQVQQLRQRYPTALWLSCREG